MRQYAVTFADEKNIPDPAMEPAIAALVLLSAVLHPLWNAIIKREPRPDGAFVGFVALLGLIALVHSLALGLDLMSIWPVWDLFFASWTGQMLYGVALTLTLKRGDLSAYYPIIRSSPLFIVAAGFLFLGQSYSWPLLGGIAMVLVGAFLLQYRRGTHFFHDPLTLLLAFLAMSGTGIYSIADGEIMKTVAPPVLMFWNHALGLPTFVVIFRILGRKNGGNQTSAGGGVEPGLFFWLRHPMRYLGVGVLGYASYLLILTAFAWGGDVAAVTAVRQASIPISVLIGGLWLREESMTRRLWASILLALGIVAIIFTR